MCLKFVMFVFPLLKHVLNRPHQYVCTSLNGFVWLNSLTDLNDKVVFKVCDSWSDSASVKQILSRIKELDDNLLYSLLITMSQ